MNDMDKDELRKEFYGVMNIKEPFGNEYHEDLFEWMVNKIDLASKQKLNLSSIGSKRPTDDEIDKWVEEYAFRVPYDGSNNFYDDAAIKHAVAGAKWARDFKAACDSEKGGEKAVRDGE